VGSTLFCWLLLKDRMIPVGLAVLGLVSSGGLVVQLLVQQAAGASTNWSSPITWAIWFPLLIFELAFAAVLLANRLGPRRPLE
jgi:multisubunit Na+/H+ antiporter MnhE subunit